MVNKAEKIELGDEVRHLKSGAVGIMDDINPKNKRERKRDDEWWGTFSTPGHYSNIDVEVPEDVVLVRKAKDIPPKALPTLTELVEFSQMAMLDDWDNITVDETSREGEPDGQFLFYGTSATGQRFGARVTISEIEWADF